ncbi:MAG: hypothetical protein PWR06_1651 [Thermoanaerobacteraceae bacterium]|jgi:allantoin racemase|uniref:Hydrogenase expression protein HupH n=1 Tax=Biomaibacter acetigenes TaxID=2316383 RepID=A0A3G2R903_9FIRM|nr:aspartate/glutamate racemase family protein [Biomaibacter acetigenes]AYO31865.1 hypothetical protein D2962_15750 [Biomaibacter acetigenes]MDK2878935.1 hypothetical protein [Thermoanaerobacteraceae bacterium]
MKKIMLVTPVSVTEFDRLAENRVREIGIPDNIKVECCSLKMGPASIETIYDESFATVALIRYIEEMTEENGRIPFDAIVINCFADPGVDALRELLDIPVVGVGESAISLASLIAPRFSIVSIQKNSVPHAHKRLSTMGISSRVASVYGIELPILDLGKSKDVVINMISEAGEKAITRDAADALVLGCTGMADLAGIVSKRLNVPVIEPTSAGIWAAISMVSIGITHGRNWMYTPVDVTKLKWEG